jgi:hypothetical protein
MIRRSRTQRVRALTCVLALALATGAAQAAEANPEPEELDALKTQMQLLIQQNREMKQTISGLQDEVQAARDEARSAEDLARQASLPPMSQDYRDGALASRQAGSMTFQLLDVSLDVLSSFGSSTAQDDELLRLQGDDHDPRQRGFNLQAVELSFMGAVDPYLNGEVHLVYFLDPEGESRFEIEEAFMTSMQLPWGLEERGFEVEFGQFFTEFGRANPQHAHFWDWQDQPFILTRFFGEDGMRAPGVRVGWLTPLPWYSELHLGAQNAKGETMQSFLANDEVFADRPVGGRPFADRQVSGVADLVYLARWVNGFDLSDTWSTQLGVSGLLGPNATGSDANTWIGGADVVFKWRPLKTDRGWPFLKLEGELLYRRYEADAFFGCLEAEEVVEGCDDPVAVGGDTLSDWGFYAQMLWGFRRNWSTGIRYEYGTGSGASILRYDGRSEDPFRDNRHRVSPLLVFQPSEFSRLRLQYNYDKADFLRDGDAHTVWAGLEFLFGSHPAHRY